MTGCCCWIFLVVAGRFGLFSIISWVVVDCLVCDGLLYVVVNCCALLGILVRRSGLLCFAPCFTRYELDYLTLSQIDSTRAFSEASFHPTCAVTVWNVPTKCRKYSTAKNSYLLKKNSILDVWQDLKYVFKTTVTGVVLVVTGGSFSKASLHNFLLSLLVTKIHTRPVKGSFYLLIA